MTKPKGRPARAKRTFSPEFKEEAVRLLAERRAAGVSLEQIARELDVGPDLLRTWAQRQAGLGPTRGHRVPSPSQASPGESEAEELRRLRREVAVLRQEREFLKKATAFFAQELR